MTMTQPTTPLQQPLIQQHQAEQTMDNMHEVNTMLESFSINSKETSSTPNSTLRQPTSTDEGTLSHF